MIDWKLKITEYYTSEPKLWTLEQVKVAVTKGKITEAEYKEITGEDYVAVVK